MKYVTTRPNQNGEMRRYFFRRGVPVLRLFGEPGTPEFAEQYAIACAVRPQPRWKLEARQKIRSAIRKRRPKKQPDKLLIAASRLARSVNSRAKHQYGVESEITTAWIAEQIKAQHGKCAVSGIPFSYERGLSTKDRRNPYAPSVDRINCSIGYTKRNSRLVLLAVNVALNLWGDDLFYEVCEAACLTRKVQRV